MKNNLLANSCRLLVLALIVSVAVANAGAQTANEPFWQSGNSFLRICDSSSSFRMAASKEDSVFYDGVCTVWIMGVLRGMSLEDQSRPRHQPTAAEEKATRAEIQELSRLGAKPVIYPNSDVCVPGDVPNSLILLVVIKYIKDHPGDLTNHAAFLAIAAFKTEWACTPSKSKQ